MAFYDVNVSLYKNEEKEKEFSQHFVPYLNAARTDINLNSIHKKPFTFITIESQGFALQNVLSDTIIINSKTLVSII